MSAIGSVFLGDFQRHRILSSSTPPSSPPPDQMNVAFASQSLEQLVEPLDDVESELSSEQLTAAVTPLLQPEPSTVPPVIDSALSLELRLRWLEALLLGVRQDAKDRKGKDKVPLPELKHGETLIRWRRMCKGDSTASYSLTKAFRGSWANTTCMPIY